MKMNQRGSGSPIDMTVVHALGWFAFVFFALVGSGSFYAAFRVLQFLIGK